VIHIFGITEPQHSLKYSIGHQARRRKEGRTKARGTGALKSIAETGAQSTMKSNKNTLHEFSPLVISNYQSTYRYRFEI
jgi:hypothetical protein